MDNNSFFPIVIHAILAFFGGCVREAGAIGNDQFSVPKFVTGALVAAFCGMVTFFLCMNYEVNSWLTAALTSLAGYAGTPVLDFFASVVKRKFDSIADDDKS